MKKIVAVLMVLVLAMSVAACQKNGKEKTSAKKTESEIVTGGLEGDTVVDDKETTTVKGGSGSSDSKDTTAQQGETTTKKQSASKWAVGPSANIFWNLKINILYVPLSGFTSFGRV